MSIAGVCIPYPVHLTGDTYQDAFYRLLLSAAFGGIIGYQREREKKHAGLRTHIIVSVASCLVMLVSRYGFVEFWGRNCVPGDPARLASHVVSGMGFLLAGGILKGNFQIVGLTTAASLWLVSGIGLACGSWYWFTSLISTIIGIITLELIQRLERIGRRNVHVIKVEVGDTSDVTALVHEFVELGSKIKKMEIQELKENKLSVTFTIQVGRKTTSTDILAAVHKAQGVKGVALQDEKENTKWQWGSQSKTVMQSFDDDEGEAGQLNLQHLNLNLDHLKKRKRLIPSKSSLNRISKVESLTTNSDYSDDNEIDDTSIFESISQRTSRTLRPNNQGHDPHQTETHSDDETYSL